MCLVTEAETSVHGARTGSCLIIPRLVDGDEKRATRSQMLRAAAATCGRVTQGQQATLHWQ